MKRLLFIGLALMAAASAVAQSRSSFTDALISGVMTTQTGNQLELVVSANPTLTVGGNTYDITEVFGVWALDNDDDMAATGGSQNGWSYSSNYSGTGGIAGWKTPPPQGLINGSLTFNFNSVTGTIENHGYHIRVAGNLPGGGDTGFFAPVPEPASMIAFGALALAALRKKRKSA